MNEIEIFFKSLRDFFTAKMLKIALIPILVTMLIIYTLFFAAADFGFSSLQEIAQASQNGEEVILDDNAPFYFTWFAYLIIFLFKYSFTSWLAAFLIYTVGAVILFKLSILLSIVVIGFLSPLILRIIHKRHYSHLTLHGHGDLLSPLIVLIKASLMMIFLFIILIPLYFIPILNIIAFSLPFYYFFHKLLTYDVASTLLNDEEFNKIYKEEKTAFRLRTLFLYFISMIPFITVFTAVFYVIYLGHAYLYKLNELYEFEIPEKRKVKDDSLENKRYLEE